MMPSRRVALDDELAAPTRLRTRPRRCRPTERYFNSLSEEAMQERKARAFSDLLAEEHQDPSASSSHVAAVHQEARAEGHASGASSTSHACDSASVKGDAKKMPSARDHDGLILYPRPPRMQPGSRRSLWRQLSTSVMMLLLCLALHALPFADQGAARHSRGIGVRAMLFDPGAPPPESISQTASALASPTNTAAAASASPTASINTSAELKQTSFSSFSSSTETSESILASILPTTTQKQVENPAPSSRSPLTEASVDLSSPPALSSALAEQSTAGMANEVSPALAQPLPQGCHRIDQDEFLQQVCAYQYSANPQNPLQYPSTSSKGLSLLQNGSQGRNEAAGEKKRGIIVCPVEDDVLPLLDRKGNPIETQSKDRGQAYAISGTMVLDQEVGEERKSSSAAQDSDDGYWRQVNGEQIWMPSSPKDGQAFDAEGGTQPEPLVQHQSTPPTSVDAAITPSSVSSEAGKAPPSGEGIAADAQAYDAWKESIGGQDAPAFLSFAEWKERHLAEKEREEQEKRERRKKEKQKEREEKKKGSNNNGHQADVNYTAAAASETQGATSLPNFAHEEAMTPAAQAEPSSSDAAAAAAEPSSVRSALSVASANNVTVQTSEPASTTSDDKELSSTSLPDSMPAASPLPEQVSDNRADNGSPQQGTSSAPASVEGAERVEMQMVAPGGTVVKGHVHDLPEEAGAMPAVANPGEYLSTLKHRWNFASLDCAAVVHRANPSARMSSSILSEKKDRYMLSSCPGAPDGDPQGQFFIVELCDEIKIDTIVMANFEFFSRMFKRFRVRVSKNLLGSDEEWIDLGDYRARNLRGLQVFNVLPPKGDLQFFKYVRIDILEHYGSEYYCPISLFRVYGLTQLDDFKKEEEETRKQLAAMAQADYDLDDEEEETDHAVQIGQEAQVQHKGEVEQNPQAASSPDQGNTSSGEILLRKEAPSAEQEYMVKALNEMLERSLGGLPNESEHALPIENATHEIPASSQPAAAQNSVASPLNVTQGHSATAQAPDGAGSLASSPLRASSAAVNNTAALPDSTTRSSPVQSSANSRQPNPVNTPQSGPAGESIYRSITKRLNALEANATLSLQYMEHNGQMLLDVFARMEKKQDERLGEMLRALNSSNWRQIEALKRRQHVDLQRAIFEFDVHRQQADSERVQLLTQVHVLGREVLLERRLSIFQLILVAGLLVFVALTRGDSSPLDRLRRLSPSPTMTSLQPVDGKLRPLSVEIMDRGRSSVTSPALGTPLTLGRYSTWARRRKIGSGGLRRPVRLPGSLQPALSQRPDPSLLTPQRSRMARIIEVSSPRASPGGDLHPLQRVDANFGNAAKEPTEPESAPAHLSGGSGWPVRGGSPANADSHKTLEKNARFGRMRGLTSPLAVRGDESVSSEWSERSDSSNTEESDAEQNLSLATASRGGSLSRSSTATLLAAQPTTPRSLEFLHSQNHLTAYPNSPTMFSDDEDFDTVGPKHMPWQQVLARRQNSLRSRSRTTSLKSSHSGMNGGTPPSHPLGKGKHGTPPRLKTPEDVGRPASPFGRSGTPDTLKDVDTNQDRSTSPLKAR